MHCCCSGPIKSLALCRRRVTRRSIAGAAFLSLLLFTAAASAQSGSGAGPAWPDASENAKIRLLGAIRSSLDAGGGKEGAITLRKPYGVAVDRSGRMYVTDRGRTVYFHQEKKQSGVFGSRGRDVARPEPLGIAVSSDGRIFTADGAASKVHVHSADGKAVASIGAGELELPSGVAVDERNGKLYVVDSRKHRVAVYGLKDYRLLRTIGSRGIEGKERFNFPTSAAVDSRGTLYVVDTGNFRVQAFDRDGRYLRSIGGIGDAPGAFARPKGIAVDSEDNVYVVDAAFQNVQIFDAEGVLLYYFGTGGLGPGRFTLPAGISIDEQDRIYVVDQWPGTVHVFQFAGKKFEQQRQRGAARGAGEVKQ